MHPFVSHEKESLSNEDIKNTLLYNIKQGYKHPDT